MGVSQPKKDPLARKSDAADKNQGSTADFPKHARASEREALIEQAPALLAVINAMRDAVIVYDMSGKPVYANAAIIAAYGVDPSSTTRVENMARLKICDMRGQPAALESLPSTRALKGEQVNDEIYRFTDAQGVERFINVSAQPVHVEGHQVGAVSFWRDVTEREMLLTESRLHRDALAQNRDMLAHVMNQAPVAIEILEGPEFRCVYANAAFERLAAGRGKTDVVGKTVTEAWPDVFGQFLPLLQHVYQTGEPYRVEEMAIPVTIEGRPDTCYHTITYTPFFDANHQVTAILDQVIDVTEQVRARHAIEMERDHLRALLESIDDEVWFCNPDGNITLINDRAAKGLGLPVFDRSAQHDLQTEVLDCLVIYNLDGTTRTDEDAPLFRALRGEHWRGGEIVYNPHTGKVMHRHVNASPIQSKEGQILGAIAVVRDITDLQKTEQALRESEAELRISEARFRGTFENVAMGIAHVGLDGRFLFVNPRMCEITGYPREALETKTFQEITHPDDLQANLDLVARVLAGATEQYTMEKRYIRQDGSIVWVNLTVALQRDSSGRPDYFIISGEDINQRKEAERALQETSKRLENFINSNMVGIVIGDAEGRIREANDYYLNLIGYSRADLETQPLRWVDLTPPEHGSADRRALAELARRGTCEPYEKEYIRKDGSRVWVLVGDTLLPDGQILAFVLDVSARKRAENDLRAALDRAEEGQRTLEALMRYVPEGIAITGGPPDFRIRLASRYGLELAGRPKAELLYLPAGQHAEAWGIREADGVTLPAPEHLPLYRASHFGEEIIGQELVVETADGRKVPVLVNAAPVRDEADRIIAAINCWRDITERKEMEAELRKSEAELREREAMLQRYADGLTQSNQDLENFAFVASHDLQEPLRKITSFGDILQDRLEGQIDEATGDLLKRMVSAGDRMKAMINDLLQLSRVNTRGQDFVQVDLNAVATEVISDLEPAIERVHGQVLVEPLPVIEADPLQMHQLLQNFISNALKFHAPGVFPVVNVSATSAASVKPDSIILTVADNGIGFEQEYFERILQPFQRLHGRGEYEGTGIGLAICKRIVERHHGQLHAESTPGEGATFFITLPVNQPR